MPVQCAKPHCCARSVCVDLKAYWQTNNFVLKKLTKTSNQSSCHWDQKALGINPCKTVGLVF